MFQGHKQLPPLTMHEQQPYALEVPLYKEVGDHRERYVKTMRSVLTYAASSCLKAMELTALILAAFLPLQALTGPLSAPTIDLGYSIYQGLTQNGINKFLGMRFAAPPTGNGRWRLRPLL